MTKSDAVMMVFMTACGISSVLGAVLIITEERKEQLERKNGKERSRAV